MEKEKSPIIIRNVIQILLIPVIVIILWQIAGDKGWINSRLIPTPFKIVDTFISVLVSGRLWQNISISFLRVITGFCVGVVLGIVLGFLMGLFKTLNRMLSLFVSILRPIPIIALIPIFILLFGIGETSKYAVISVGTFWTVLLNTIHGVQSADPKLLEVASAYGIRRRKTIFKIILPSALPSILTGLRLGVSSSWMSVVAAEMFAASRGIGFMITFARDNSQTAVLYMGVLTIGLVGLVLDKILIALHDFYLKKSRGVVD